MMIEARSSRIAKYVILRSRNRIVICAMTLIFALSGPLLCAQPGSIQLELERIHESDQYDRQNIHAYVGAQKDSVVAHMQPQDSLNLRRIVQVIDSAGWLGPEQVGHKASQAQFLVLQHADAHPGIQKEYLEIMREAVTQGKARAADLAMLEDRVAVNHGRPQIYGSQIGWKNGKPFIQPLYDEEHVNELRAKVGLEPLEEYAQRFGLKWSPPVKQERILLMPKSKP